jgi:hypothetical protein
MESQGGTANGIAAFVECASVAEALIMLSPLVRFDS